MIEVGQTIGNYRITAKLGEGGMGVVFLAEHPVIGKKVAMKAIHPELSRNAEVISRFMTEAKSVNQIGNEHIVDISDFGTTSQGEFYFVMEYLQGAAIADRLKQVTRMPPPQALYIAAQVADALGASHQHGIIHRDLKPENIYLVSRGGSPDFVKVLDFGLAKLTQGDEKVSHKTRTGSVMGTPYYMAPEQCEGRATIDHRADIYSLGVILFETLTGKVPFGGEGYGEIIVKHITQPIPLARDIVPELSPGLDLILHRAMAKNRDDRFPTMADFRAALLDPEGYAADALRMSASRPVGGGARATGTMSRQELDRASQIGLTLSASRSPSGTPSTFRETVGEILDEEAPAKHPRGKMVLVAAVVAAAAIGGIFVLKGNKTNRRSASNAAGSASIPAPTPATVRVNFNSDPEHALVVRADTGQELGRTPLSTEVPYGDTAVEFVFKKDGFDSKVEFVVPNLPTPLFVTLQPIARPVVKKEPEPVVAANPTAVPSPPQPPKKVAHKKPRVQRLDDDAVLEPTFK